MRRSLLKLNERHLPKALRQALVLFTLLILPSAAWGQATITVAGNAPDATTGNITGEGISFAGEGSVNFVSTGDNSGTLTLNNATINGAIVLSNALYFLTIDIIGTNTIQATNSALIKRTNTDYWSEVRFTSSTKTGSLTLENVGGNSDEGLLYYVEPSATNNLAPKFPSSTDTWATATKAEINALGLTVAGVTVTTGNNTDILEGDNKGKVSFTLAEGTNPATLTLENATIIPEGEGRGISYTGTDNLTISLKGSNTVKGVGGCNAILYDGTGAATPTLTFTNGGTEACSLQLEAENTQTIGSFANVINTGLYKIDETILGADQSNTYKTIITTLGGGSGTSSDPIIIKTAEDLRDFAKLVNKGTITNEYIKLNPKGGELGCDGLTGFEPIGFSGKPFIGKFDGNNCTINNLAYSTEGTGDYVGLFGIVGNEDVSDAKIEKLTLSNCSFNGGESVGGIVGEMVNGTIENCVLSSCTVKGGDSFNLYAGGIAGQVKNGTISTCAFNSGLVDGSTAYSGAPSTAYAGGIVGYIYSTNSVTVSSCTVSSTNVKSVTSGGDGAYNIYVGGLVGRSLGTVAISYNKITNTDNTKKISCQNINGTFTTYHCGAIIGGKGDETILTNNTYEYDVTTEIAETPKSGYTHRGSDAETDPSGISLYTQLVALPKSVTGGTITGADGTYYKSTDEGIYVVPGKTATLNATPTADTSFEISWLQAVNATTTDVITPDSTSIDGGGRKYEFEMPDAQVDVTAKFAINLAADGITATIANATCTGEAIEPTTIAVEGIANVASLTKDTDFTITGYTKGGEAVTSPIDVGTYTVSIKGKGDYTGTKDVSYTIEKGIAGLYFYHIKGDQEDPVLAVEEATYGTAYDSPRLKNPHNLPITFSCKAENSETGAESDVATIDDEGNVTILKAGTVYVYAVAAENDNYDELDVHYQLNIDKADFSDVTIANIADQTYTGSAITPELTVTTPDGTSVTTDDYGIGYTPDNTNVGEVTITLTAKEGSEKFTESTTTTFNIIPPTPTIAFDNTKTYLNTDKIAISIDEAYATSSATAGITNTIYYSWDENPVTGTEYSEGGVAAQTGTLTAWVSAAKSGTNYESEKTTQEFTVKTDISDYTVQGLATSATYTGAAIVPAFSVKASADAATSLTLNADYTVSYQSVIIAAGDVGSGPSINYTDVDEMVEVGAYRIVITGTGDNYGGTTYADFAIDKADLDIVTIEAIEDQPYTGSAIEPEITVTLNGEEVAADDNFYITYSQNTEVSTETLAYVTLTAIGSSECFREGSTKTASFKIVPKSIEGVIVTLSGDGFDSEKYSFVYNGENQKPTVTVEDGERLLILDTDYTLTNNGGTNVGEYTFTITGKGNYDKNTSIELFYRITPKSIAGVTISLDPEATYVYNGDEQKPVPEVNDGETLLEKDVDYIVSYSNNINAAASTAENAPTIIITGKGNYDETTTATATFTINQTDLADAAISKIAFGGKEYTVGDLIEIPYTGEAIQPTVEEVKINDGTVTVDASDYNVSYSNNTEISSDDNLALIIITSTGKNFTEGTSTSQGFKIVRATVTITAEDQTVTYNADKQEYDISKIEVSNNNAKLAINYYATVDDRSKGENALTDAPTNADTYYVRVTLNEECQQHYVADPADATFTIDQLEMTNDDNTTITLDNTELTYNEEAQTVNVTKVMVGEIEVPAECYEVSDNTATEAGTYTAKVTAKTTNADGSAFKNNFKGSATIDWKINHRTASAAELGFTSETQTASTYYNPNEDFNLPEGYVGYIVTGINGTNVLTTRVSYIQKGVAVLVEKGTSSANAIDEAPDPATLPLKGTSEPLEVSSIAGGTVYVLYNGEFVKSTSGTIPGKRCYLLIESSAAAGTRAFGINHNMDANGIDSALFDDNDVKTDDKWFNLQGRRIEKPTKAGIYVVNGKKVMINNK